MPYNLTLTNGTLLTTLADSDLDTTSTSLSLIGKNRSPYGLYLNENFLHLLENFASTTAPLNPIKGQMWFDNTNFVIKIYNGTVWKEIAHSTSAATAPANSIAGDLWWDTGESTLKVYTGSAWVTVGPTTPPGTALTTLISNTVIDTLFSVHTVGNVIVNNKLTSVFSSDTSPFNVSTPILGLTTIQPGLNIGDNLQVNGNIVSNGTLLSKNAVFSGNVTFTGNVAIGGTPSFDLTSLSTSVAPSANLTYNLGSTTNWWNNIYGTAIHAQYADLAERFEADATYEPGTVVELGGAAEITQTNQDLSENVFGVISTKAAYLMNSQAGTDQTHPPIAVQGRVPVKVTGQIRKGDRLVSAGNGLARAGKRNEITAWNVIGRALENKTTDGEGIIEAVVKLNS